MEQSEEEQYQLAIMADLKNEIKKYLSRLGLMTSSLKIEDEQLDSFVQSLREEGLLSAKASIEEYVAPKTLSAVCQPFQEPHQEEFRDIVTLHKRLISKAQLCKISQFKEVAKLFERRIFERNDYYQLRKDLPSMMQEIFDKDLEIFLTSYTKAGFFDRLEFYYIAKTDKKIAEELERNNFQTAEKNHCLKELEAEARRLLENFSIEIDLIAPFLQNLNLESLLAGLEQEIAPIKFNNVEAFFRNSSIIANNLSALENIARQEELKKTNSLNEAQKLEVFYEIVQRIRGHVFKNPKGNTLEVLLENFLKKPDLKEFVLIIEDLIPPKHFEVIETNIQEDIKLQGLIEKYRKLLFGDNANDLEKNDERNTRMKIFQLEQKLSKSLDYYRHKDLTEEVWKQVVDILKDELNLEEVLRVLEEEIPPVDFQELKEDISQDKDLSRVLMELDKLTREGKRSNTLHIRTPGEDGLAQSPGKIIDFNRTNSLSKSPNSVDVLDKIRTIVTDIALPHIDFKSFNIVSFRPTPEEQTRIVQDWIQNLNDPSKFRELLPIYFNLLKRSEDWSGLQDTVNSVISDKAKRKTLDFVHSKFLFYLLMVSADNELRARLLQLYSTYSPVPLKYLKWPTHQQVDNNLLEYEYNEQLYYNIKPSLGVFSFGIGQRAAEKMGKSTILNKIFMTAFATDVNPEFHSGTIDIDLDMKFRPSRNFCIADAHGRFRLAELPAFLGLFKIFIIHVHSEDLKDEGAAQDLKYLCTSIQNTKSESYFNIIIRDSSLAMDVVDDFETLQKEYKPLEILSSTLKQDHFQVLAVNTLNSKGDKAQLSQLIYQKLQKKILTSVQQFQNVISIDKKTFAEKFLWSIGQDKEISKVHKSIQNFIDELKKYSDNFFDQKVFPYRYLLSTLRRAQSVLRIAKNEDEIKKAKSVVAEVESQLKQVKATKIMKLFTELLCQPNSYLILMEISKEIKLIVDSSCETLLTQKAEFATQLKEQAGQTGKELKNWMSLIETELHTRSLSIEVLWRELLALYTYNEKEVTDIMKVDIVSKIQEFLDKGEPFELIDGDNLQFNEALLEKLFTRMKGKMCNVSVIGPQSSGKSTLLNYLFGCQFVSSVGRCTRGIYLSLLKVHNNPDYDYLMILDTEGLQSTEKNDEEFDKKITLFCLAVSQIIVLNVKGEIHAPMKSLLMICSLSLSEIEKAKIEQPAFYYVFNQNPSSNKSPFMTQIGSMMQEVMESTEQVSAAAEILRPNEQNIHVFGIAYKISKIEEDSGKGVWTDWSYMEPQSSFAIESSDLARVITRKIQARITSRKGNQSTLGFVEWSGLAKEIWKTIDMFPNIVNFSEFRTLKQEKELLVYCAQILEDKKEKLSQLRREGKLTLDNLDEECKEIKSEIEEEIMEIRLKYQYDYDQTRKWIRDSQGRIDSHRSEILVALNKDVLQDRIQQEQRKGFKEISERISESLLDPALRGSKEKAISKFNQIWKKYIEDNLSEVINIEVYDEEMWKVLTQVYTKETPDFPDLPTDLVKKLKSSINPDSDKGFNENKKELKLLTDGILSEVKALGIQGNLLQEDEKNEAFLKDIYIKYRQPAFYLSLPNYLSPTLIVKYINIKDLLKNNVDWDMFKQDLFASLGNNYVSKGLNIAENILSFFNKQAAVVLINAIQEGYTLFKSTQNHKIFDNIMSVLLAFAPFGYLPDGYLVTDIKDKLHEGPLTQEKLKELLKHYTSLDRLFCPTENPKFDSEQSVPPIKYFKNAIIETKKIENKEIDEALKEMNHFIDRSYDFTVLKNHTWVFTSKNPTYEEGLKFTVNPYNQNIARSKASENLKDLITSQTDWQKYLEDVCTDIIKEVDVKASYLKQSSQENAQEAYHKDISSFSVDLVKNLVKTVTAKINQLDKEILRCGHKLDRAARGRIHVYSLLITWKILSFASKKRLMDPIEKIKKDKDKWQAYFVSSVNNNLHEKSTSFADRIITEYIENIKQAALRGKIVPKAEEAMRAKKSDFNVEKIQKSLDDTILLADSGQSQKVLEYVFNQNQHFEKQFEKVWSDHYSPLVKNQMKNYKEIVVSHLESTLKTISGLYDFFKNQNKKKKNVMPLDMFEIRDSENQIINIDSDLTIEQMGNNNNELVEFWSVASFELFTQYCTDQVSEKWVYTHENKKYTAKVKGLNKALKPILLINFKKGSSLSEKENQIPLLYVFLEKLQEILIAEINIISTTDLKWGYATIGLDILYQTYKNASVGCTESCPACGRKCDRLGDNHRHRCENGHQIRGMHGIKQGSSLSAKTCDEIKPESQLQIDQQAGKIKWQEFVKRFPEWDFTPYDPKNPPEAIFKFKNCWKLHGLEFCRHYSQLYGQDIRYAPVLEVDSYHFILILDGSGSMKGKPWEDAVSGAKNFLNKVKEIESNLKGVSVSLIVFNDKAQTLAKYEQVGTHLIEKLVFPGGGTNFDAPLQNAYQLIEGNTKFDKHVLLFYTDGGANYPGNAMQKILNYGDKSKISFYALSAEKNPVVLSNIANQFQAFSVGEVKPNITPDMLVSALPEILNSMFHQV